MDNWVTHFVEEERQRDQAHSREAEDAARRADHLEFHLRQILDSLGAQVAGDVKAFARAFPERAITFEGPSVNGGFTVRRARYPEGRLKVEPDVRAGTIIVDYLFASQAGTLAPKPKVLELGGHTVDTLHFRDDSEQQAFRTIGQLSEYLLVPVFTGRPR